MRRPPAVARVLEKVTATAREHDMLRAGDNVLAACSGGPDSVCLLYSLCFLRRLFKVRLAVFHFDHRLRGDSAMDAEYVRRLAERLRIPFHLGVAGSKPRKGESVEAWASVARARAANEVRKEIDAGVIAGYPVEDLRVIVYDGKSHAVDSKEIAFVSAGRKAVIDAFAKAGPIMLEPIVNIDIDAPETYVGDMTAEIASKRGQITGTQQRSADVISTTGQVPLAELVDFQNRLRSITGGQGSYSVEFSHYAQVPGQMQQQLMSQYKAAREEE